MCANKYVRLTKREGRHLSILKEERSTHESTFDAMISSKLVLRFKQLFSFFTKILFLLFNQFYPFSQNGKMTYIFFR